MVNVKVTKATSSLSLLSEYFYNIKNDLLDIICSFTGVLPTILPHLQFERNLEWDFVVQVSGETSAEGADSSNGHFAFDNGEW
jgi:hypothetical protein